MVSRCRRSTSVSGHLGSLALATVGIAHRGRGWRNPFRSPATRRTSRGKLYFESLEPRQLLAGDLVISEVLAANDNDLRDADRNRPDWVEVLNTGAQTVNLDGWFLTDDATNLSKWRFPEVQLPPAGRAIVFASGKNRAQTGAELHTNFKLNAQGEYLALVEPDGATVAFEYAPQYPPQIADVSFGLPQEVMSVSLLAAGDPARIWIPTSDQLGTSWREVGFDDGAWMDGLTGVGYSFRSEFDSAIQTNVKTAMRNVNGSAYVRLPFHVDDPHDLVGLALHIQYNDGYVAFLNGTEVARSNAPDEVPWNALAASRRDKNVSLVPEEVDLTPFLDRLRAGDNVLAIQGLNSTVNSSRFLVAPELTALIGGPVQTDRRSYFVQPTAGGANGLGTSTAIVDVGHVPQVPAMEDDLTVTATVISTVGDVAPVTLRYRVMYGDELTVPMLDDGQHGDGAAGDGVYGATISAGFAAPGQMIRYRITAGDTAENMARRPIFIDPVDRQEYFGTVVADPSIESNLPLMHMFLEDPAAADTAAGTHGSLFYDGEFYDNIYLNEHGHTTLGLPKISHDVFVPRDHQFQPAAGLPRYEDFDLFTNYINRAKIRNTLAYETYRKAGVPAHIAFHVRVDMNGEFFGIYEFVEDGDNEYLERAGLDPRGALYKPENSLAVQSEKKTRTWEDNSDLVELLAGLGLDKPKRTRYVFDHINIPAMVNYLAALVVAAHGDCCQHNYYAYRDTEGTGEWQYLPWDMDASFGRGGRYREEPTPAFPVPFMGRGNLLIDVLYDTPGFNDMYFRRLRTLMDELLQPPDTPRDQLKFEQRIDELAELLAPDVPLDFAKWGSWGKRPSWQQRIDVLKNEYFPSRRAFLYGAKGDMDLDGDVDADDGKVLAQALADPDAYTAQYGLLPLVRGDTNYDLMFDVDDISKFVLGDMNFNGTIGVDDVKDFILALTQPDAYRVKYGVPATLHGDINSDGMIDVDDIGAFIGRTRGGQFHPSGIRPAQVGAPTLQFGAIEFDPASGNQDEEYIELINPNNVAVDISGWRLTGGIEHTFAPGTVLPHGGTIYVSPNVNAFRARTTGPSSGQGLFIQGDYSGHLSNRGETITLVATDGTVVATVTTPAQSSAAQDSLRISEIMYHPADPAAGSSFEDDDFEFVELVNTSATVTVPLEKVTFTQGIDYTFPAVSLAPGERILVVRNEVAFSERYGAGRPIAGQYGGAAGNNKLDNGGEALELVDANGGVIQHFAYADNWYPDTDGGGYSLEVLDPAAADLELWGRQEGWVSSGQPGGTPGADRGAGAVAAVGVGTPVDNREVFVPIAATDRRLPTKGARARITPVATGAPVVGKPVDRITGSELPNRSRTDQRHHRRASRRATAESARHHVARRLAPALVDASLARVGTWIDARP